MQKVAETNAAKKFADYINYCLGQKSWTPTMLYIQSNTLTKQEKFSPRTLQYWMSGKGLPKLESVIAMAEALKMPDLIDKRVQLERERFRQ